MNTLINSDKMNNISYFEKLYWCLRITILSIFLQFVQINVYGIGPHTITVIVHEHGQVSYNGNVYRNETFSFKLYEVEYTQIVLTPDKGYSARTIYDSVGTIDWATNGSNPTYLKVPGSSDCTIDVYFDEIPEVYPTHTITVIVHEQGQVSYNGNVYRNETFSFKLYEVESTQIVLTPDNGYSARTVYDSVGTIDWATNGSNPTYLKVPGSSDCTIDVYFDEIPYCKLDIVSLGMGNVSFEDKNIRNTTLSFYVDKGSSPILAFYPDNGYRIVINTYTLYVKATGNGSATYNGTTAKNNTQTFTLNEGTSATITFAPDNGYRIKSVKVNSTDVTSSVSNNQYTISSISANTTVEVEFEAIPIPTYTLSVKATGNGSATYKGTAAKNNTQSFTLSEGTSATITFSPDNGYRIKSVKVDSTDVTSSVSNNQYTVNNIKANTTVEVEFEAIPINSYTLKYVVDGVTYRTYQIQEGATITPEAFPTKDGYTFSGWSEIPKTMPAKDITVVGTFTKDEPVINTYTLTLTASGNGFATFNNTTAKNDSKTFTLNEGTSATIAFTPDSGYRIKSVKVNSVDVTSSVSNNSYTVSNIKDNTTVNVEFEAIPTTDTTLISGDKFEVDGITYVVNNDVNTVSVTSGNAKYSGDVAIPSSVVYLGNTYSVTSIGSWAFAFCDELTSVTIPNSVTSIDMDAFQECSLTSITIPNSVTDIRFEAFRNCSLTSVTIPSSVSSIGYGAFFGCDLTTITSEIENPFEIEESVFDGIPSDAQLIVPKGTKAAYQETEGWNKFTNIVEAGEEPDLSGLIHINDILYKVTGTGEVEVVSAENGVTSITIPSSVSYNNTVYKVTSIAKDAFEDCDHLSAVIWEPDAQFNAKVNNPNFLLYVSDEKYASHTVKNVVVNGVAENIELTDAANGNDFYCPKAFKARSIVYSHNYQMETGIGDSRGWETIVLPFDVQKYTHATKGELESFTTWSKVWQALRLTHLISSVCRITNNMNSNTRYQVL